MTNVKRSDLFNQVDLKESLLSDQFEIPVELEDKYKNSWFINFKYYYLDTSANIYKYFAQHPLFGYSFRRIFYGIITLLISVVLLFIVIRTVTPDEKYLPSNIDKLGLSDKAKEELLIERMKRFGVYGPLLTQIWTYLINITPFIPKYIHILSNYTVESNGHIIETNPIYELRWIYLGVSSNPEIGEEGSDVLGLFLKAMPYSFAIGSVSVIIANVLGISIGIQAAKNKQKTFDNAVSSITALIIAVPSIVLILLIFIISVVVFQNSGLYNSGSFATRFWPVFAIVLISLPSIITYTRRYVLEEATADYVKFAMAKGLSSNRIYYLHIFRNASTRILRSIPSQIILTIFGSSMIVENQWSIPGMGGYVIKAAGGGDFFIFLGFTVLSSFVSIFASLIADLLHVLLDPRIKLAKK